MKLSLRSQAFLFVCLACFSLVASGGTNPPQAAAPVFSLAGGLYNTPQNLVLTDSTPGAVIYYNTDGKTPNASSAIYTAPIIVASTETVTAIAIAPGYSSSVESAKAYRYVPFPLASAPYFGLAGGTYSTPKTLVLTDSTPGARMCYTTNGKSPLDDQGLEVGDCTWYTGPITISKSELVQAVAIAPGYNVSNASNKKYTIAP